MFDESTYWEMIVSKDYYDILSNNIWNRQHPEVHDYLVRFLNACGSAASKKELEENVDNCIKFRESSKITGTEDICGWFIEVEIDCWGAKRNRIFASTSRKGIEKYKVGYTYTE